MKRLLICTALLCVSGLIVTPAKAADRGFALLDNVPIADTPQLVNSSADAAIKPAVNESKFLLSKTFDLTAESVDQIVDVGQQSALSHTAPNMIALTLTGSEAWGSSMAYTRCEAVAGRYFAKGDTFLSETRLRPDPHLVKVQVLA